MESKAIGKVMSLPNIRDSSAELGRGRLYSMSLSQIKKYSESSVEFQHKLSPFVSLLSNFKIMRFSSLS